jgi:peroxiredoxin (alkyl hydroperoxide reductase subunit C)
MAEEMEVGCARPTGGPVGENIENEPDVGALITKEASPMIQVGKKAPDFVAPGYQNGKFISVKLSEFLGKWVLLCFHRFRKNIACHSAFL